MNPVIYTSPNGSEFTASPKTWEESFSHAAPKFPLANGNGDKYQDLGVFSSTIPVRFEFERDSADVEAFYNAIRERGTGKLTEPDSNKTKNVQPLSIVKSFNLVKDIKRTFFDVTFGENVKPEAIESTTALRQKNNAISDNATNLTANNFEVRQNITTVGESVRQQSNFAKTLEDMNTTLSIDVTSLQSQIDGIVRDPVNVLIAAKNLMELPGVSFDRVKSKIEGYADLVKSILVLDDSLSAETSNQKQNDAFYVQAMGSMALNAMANNVVDSEFKTKSEALETAQILVDQYIQYRDQLDQLQESGSFVQDGSIQQSLANLIYETVSFIFEISFSLKSELIFKTEKLTTIFQIAEEYYPEDWREDEISTFDFIAETNDFFGNDFVYLDPGKEVKVYV